MHLAEVSTGGRCKRPSVDHGNNTRSLPRHFKLSGHTRVAAQNYYDHIKDTLYVTKSIALICQQPYVHAAHIFLNGLYRCWKDQGSPSLESTVYSLLYEVTLPPPGRSMSFTCYPKEQVLIQRPTLVDELPFFDFPLRELFTLLGVDCVIQLFTCILLENQILLCSSEYQRLMLVAESLTALLLPFSWPHVYVPILPASCRHFLDAPVPFLMGLHTREPRLKNPSEGNLCFVDLDSRAIQMPEELPTFPHKSEFISEICDVLKRYKVPGEYLDLNLNNSGDNLMTSSCLITSNRQRKHSWADDLDDEPSLTQGSEMLKRIVLLAKRAGSSLDGLDDIGCDWDSFTDDGFSEEMDTSNEGEYSRDLKINTAVREIFLNRFVQMFSAYEHFVILPNQDKEEWLCNRESMQNFDKATFLSDQPQQQLPFLSRFIETQMFATLVDNKILSAWQPTDPNLRVLEKRIRHLRERYGENVARNPGYEPCRIVGDSLQLLDKRLACVDTQLPAPRELLTSYAGRTTSAGFPLLDSVLLNQEPSLRKRSSRLTHSHSSSMTGSMGRCRTAGGSEAFPLGGVGDRLATLPNKTEASPALIAQTNWNFVEKLLKDCKQKTKRMLVEKLGTEALEMGHSAQTSLVEENTLLASLCDLLERVWSHGLQSKQGKSSLWSHLLNYLELEESSDSSKPVDPNSLTPALAWCVLRKRMDYLSSVTPETSPNEKSSRSRSETRTSNSRRLSEENMQQPTMKTLPNTLVYDLRSVQAMTDIKTHIGYARAFVRLSLEKKLLSRHLRTLLSDTRLLRTLYKRYAFLRCEEEKEQFLYHLLTLNAVDYYCFTNTYTMTRIPYRVAIFPSRKSSASTTSANCWIAISGSNGETQRVPVPKGALEFVFHHKNLGILTTLRIGHDNSGLSPKWMVECVVVRNEVTGHSYNFPCGRWLGKGIDDDSTERLLVGERERERDNDRSRGLGSRIRSPSVPPPKKALPLNEIQHMLGDCVNNLVKYFYQVQCKDSTSSLTVLLCGETGLVSCLEQAFLHGFKSVRLFGRNLYIWDFIVKVREEKENLDNSDGPTGYFVSLVDAVLNSSHALGKDGRFQIFICIAVRDHMLQHIIARVLARSRTTLEMFEENSFFRDVNLLTYMSQILQPLDEFNIVLENSLTQGIKC
ncbi:hypothetical protein AAG570_002873 [Ranatra chinensis]|uniref:DENN domain-containing protein 5B n=1 Tax=Ranatra chinensis TaxID=642074 RepID=A0ABD0YRW7_9HEMI